MNKKYFINSAISVAIMLFFRFIPTFGSMTPLGMTILGIFIGALYGWIKCDMVWPSVLAMVLLGFTGYSENVAAIFTSAISNPTIQMMLWLLVFSAILTVSGISKQLATRMVRSRLCKGRPWVLTISIYLAALVGAAFGGVFAAILICWDFTYSISEAVGYTKHDKWPKMMIVSVVVAICVGGVLLPFQVGVAATYGYLFAASNGTYAAYNYMTYLIFSLILSVFVTALYFTLCRFVIRPDMSKLKVYEDTNVIEAFDTKQKIAIWALVAMIFFTVLPSCLPACALKSFMGKIGTTAIILIITVVITYLRDKNGKPFYTFKQLADAGIFWPMMFMVATAVVMGTALSSGDTGFTTSIMAAFNPIFSGAGKYVFGAVICLATILLTNVINNAVAGAIMIPVMYSFSTVIGANPLALAALICLCSNMGLLLPCASPAGAMMYSNKEWISSGDIVKHSCLGIVSVVLVIWIVGIPLGNILF